MVLKKIYHDFFKIKKANNNNKMSLKVFDIMHFYFNLQE